MLNFKNKKLKFTVVKILFLLFSIPGQVFAAPRNFAEFLGIFTNIFDLAIPILMTAALAGFFYGIAKTIFEADDPNQRMQGRKAMLFSIFAFFAVLAIWGITTAVRKTFFGY